MSARVVVTGSTSPTTSQTEPTEFREGHRWRSVDVLRGATVAFMVVVNNMGDGAHVFPALAHAKWNGWTLADLVFPTFLFVMGASLSLGSAVPDLRRAWRRAAILVMLGLLVQALPRIDLDELRYPGVLQRLGLTYLIAAIVVRYLGRRGQLIFCVTVLIGYTLLLRCVPFGGHPAGTMTPSANLPGRIDQLVFGGRHVYGNGGYDPEGLLGALPATVNVLVGSAAARYLLRQGALIRKACGRVAICGTALVFAGVIASRVIPINKRLWTSSFVVLSSGFSVLAFAITALSIDARRTRSRASSDPRPIRCLVRILEALGRNALLVYIGSEELHYALTRYHVPGTVRTWRHWGDAPFMSLLSPRLASLAYAGAVVTAFALFAAALHRRRLYLRL